MRHELPNTKMIATRDMHRGAGCRRLVLRTLDINDKDRRHCHIHLCLYVNVNINNIYLYTCVCTDVALKEFFHQISYTFVRYL